MIYSAAEGTFTTSTFLAKPFESHTTTSSTIVNTTGIASQPVGWAGFIKPNIGVSVRKDD